MQKKLGFRMTMDVVPLDAGLVEGSHGLAAADPRDRPLLIGDGPRPETENADDGGAGRRAAGHRFGKNNPPIAWVLAD